MIVRKGEYRFRAKLYKHLAQHYTKKGRDVFTVEQVAWTLRVEPGHPRRAIMGTALRRLVKEGALAREGNGRIARYRVASVAKLVALHDKLLEEKRATGRKAAPAADGAVLQRLAVLTRKVDEVLGLLRRDGGATAPVTA